MSFSALHNCHERDPTVDALSKVCQLTLFGIKMNTHVISFYKVESKVEIIAGSEMPKFTEFENILQIERV